jgi:pyroglutamyl-peptidase
MILVTGFEPFGQHSDNPSRELAKAVDGRRIGGHEVRGSVLPVHHSEAAVAVERLVADLDPIAILHLGLAEGRARIGLERVALNVLDYSIPDASGYQGVDEPCVAGGPAAYASTLPLRAILAALTAEGIPAFISNSAGTYLCNQTLYTTLHLVSTRRLRARVGFLHLPLLPAMVAAAGVDQPSMAAATMLRAVEVTLEVIATTGAGELAQKR